MRGCADSVHRRLTAVGTGRVRGWGVAVFLLAAVVSGTRASDRPAVVRFHREIQPILADRCYDCHGDGMKKGGIAFDELTSDRAILDRQLWWRVLKNVRAGIMPPARKPRPSPAQREILARWIKYDVFGIDPNHPDPGRVTLRRLNRVEYRNTIRSLMGIDFKADEEFPPDDTGYGFDDIGDVLTVSPLLLEKYLQAAEVIVAAAVPTVPRVEPEQIITGSQFHGDGGDGGRLSFYRAASVSHPVRAEHPGHYHLRLDLAVTGGFDFDPGRCSLVFKVDDRPQLQKELAWQDHRKFEFDFDVHWPAGAHRLVFDLDPLTPPDQKRTFVELRILSVRVQGPEERAYWTRTRHYDWFFPADQPPRGKAARRRYARQVLRAFATRAFRRPVDAVTLNRLVTLAEQAYNQPHKRFEDGVAQAMVATLSSPRFLFRVEEPAADNSPGPYGTVDEYSLASRLSYFLWSTMPDAELFGLAARRELRTHLQAQVRRMLADRRSEEFIRNFVGQWLQVRDVADAPIDAAAVLRAERDPATAARPRQARFHVPAELELDDALRRAMQQETELFFADIVHGDRSVLELINSDYTFLNGRLARFYGIPGVRGGDMRRVQLPPDSPRGGVLTQGSILLVTSNPTRTSPVKRGLFILDNLLGMPPPPPPPNVPRLEQAATQFKDHQPTLREVLELHRHAPLCSTCHSRMDPLGLALENFDALGHWRQTEHGRPIDASGRLITGETFNGIAELKRILVEKHRRDFYRCLTEKLLTYALGRGLEYYDVETVDRIVDRLDQAHGRFSALLMGVIQSAPFQERRTGGTVRLASGQRAVRTAASGLSRAGAARRAAKE